MDGQIIGGRGASSHEVVPGGPVVPRRPVGVLHLEPGDPHEAAEVKAELGPSPAVLSLPEGVQCCWVGGVGEGLGGSIPTPELIFFYI